jgi:N-acylglucosamine-6-phosphate 2-epimerase
MKAAAHLAQTRWSVDELDALLRGRLVVSCQPVDGGPMDDDSVVARMAQAAVAGGAAALRIEGAARLARVRSVVAVPLIGIVKRELPNSPVRITPWLDDVRALVAAGADVVAVDATARPRPASVRALCEAISAQSAIAMADAAGDADALAAWAMGFPIVGSTLSGYTGGPDEAVPGEPDLALVRRLSAAGCRVMAEGRYDTPARAAAALQAGAWAVTVGSAITRLEVVTGWFQNALLDAQAKAAQTPVQSG